MWRSKPSHSTAKALRRLAGGSTPSAAVAARRQVEDGVQRQRKGCFPPLRLQPAAATLPGLLASGLRNTAHRQPQRVERRGVFKPWAAGGQRRPTPREDAFLDHWFSKPDEAQKHRPATEEDADVVVRVGGERLGIEEVDSLGVRVQRDALSEMQEQLLQMEASELIKLYGFSPPVDSSVDQQGKVLESKNHANATRVTGRPEGDAPVAPWGFGDQFRMESVPDALRFVVEEILDSPKWAVGKPRHLTINRRENSFFKLEPQLDPVGDGECVFIVCLLSNSVITLCPPGEFDRRRPAEISLESWTDQDVDVLMRRRSMLLLSGMSRNIWRHGIRKGVQVETETDGNKDLAVCDWWGKKQNLVRRSPQMLSITLAFEKVAEMPQDDSSLFD